MVEKLDDFKNKLDLFQTDVLSGRLLHFSTLKTVGDSKIRENTKTFITQLRDNFFARFVDFAISKDVV